jgi:chemotaxis protein CheD
MDKIVGIGGYAISNNKDDVIKTFALASCVALTIYCPVKNAAGMAHIALPAPDGINGGSNTRPCYYAATAVPLLINEMCNQYGCKKNNLIIKLFGGADSIQVKDVFEIGKKNLNVIKESLTYMNLQYDASETGGKYSRTLEMSVSNGDIRLTLQPIKI